MARERNIRFRITSSADSRAIQELNRELIELRNTLKSLTKGQKKTLDDALNFDKAKSEGREAIKMLKDFTKEAQKLGAVAEKAGDSAKELGNDLKKATTATKQATSAEEKRAAAARATDDAYDALTGTTKNYRKDMDGLTRAIRQNDSVLGSIEKSLTSGLSRAMKEGSRDVGTLLTELRQLSGNTSKVDKALEGLKTIPDEIAAAQKRLATATADVTDAQNKLIAVQNKPNRSVEEIDEARRAMDQANKSFDAAEKELTGVNNKFKAFGETVNTAERRVVKLRHAIEERGLEEFISARDMNRLKTLEDALVSAGRGVNKFGITAEGSLKDTLKLLDKLGASRTKLNSFSDGLEEMRRNLVGVGRFNMAELMRDIGNPRSAIQSTTNAIRQQVEEQIKFAASTNKMVSAIAKWEAAEEAKTVALQQGRRALEQQKRLEQMYAGSLSDAKSARSTLDSRSTQLLIQENRLLQQREALLRNIAATRVLRDTSTSRDTEQYAEATTKLRQYMDALTQVRHAQDLNQQNIRENTNAWKASGAAIDQIEQSYGQMRAELVALRNAANINVFKEMASMFQAVTRHAMSLANALTSQLSTALRTVTNAARSFVSSMGNMFAGLQRSLQSISSGFRDFGNNIARSMSTARASMMEFYAAGYSLLTIGSQIQQFGNTMWRGMGRGLEGFLQYEQARTQAGIAGAQPVDASGNIVASGQPVDRYLINSGIIDDIIFDLQRGIATPEWLGGGGRPIPVAFDAKELAQGLYYYSSAIGAPITEANRGDVSDAVATIMQMARITNTGVETATKGVLNVMMEFGYNPRNIGSDNADIRAQAARDTAMVAAQMGYLANISSMEVSDIVETFKMVGPQANLLTPGALALDANGNVANPGAGLLETFAMTYLASEVGLRGGNVGRGINQAFSSLLDPTAKMLEVAGKHFGDGTAMTVDQFNATFKDSSGALKGGITGFLTTLAQIPREAQAQMLAELFTSNATRSLMGPVLAGGGFDIEEWTSFLTDMRDNPFKWMEAAAAETANTVTGWFTFMKNGWFQFQAAIVGSISGQLMNGFRLVGEVLFEVAERIKQFPAIGRSIAVVVAAVASLASVLGTLMIGAGAILLVGRSFGMLGGMVLPVIRIILMAGATIFALLPIIGLIAIAAGLAAAAFRANAFGIADGVENIKNAFNNFDEVIMPIIDRAFNGLGKMYMAFMEFINGILLGIGPLDNLGTMLKTVFGDMLGGAFFGALLRLRDSLDGTRESVKAFMSRDTFDHSAILDAKDAAQGFFEVLFLGIQDQENRQAANRLGMLLGIDDFGSILERAARDFNRFIQIVLAVGRQVGGVWLDLTRQIRDNLERALTGGNIENVFQNLVRLAISIGQGMILAFTTILGAINNVVAAVADVSVALNNAGDAGRSFLGFTFTLNEALQAIGMTIGVYLGTRLALMFTPLGAILTRVIPLVASLGAAVVAVGGRFIVFGAQVAISVASAAAQITLLIARLAALTVIQGIGGLFQFIFNTMSLAAGTAATAVQTLAIRFGLLNLAMLGVVGIGFVVAAGIYAVVAATQGFGQANALAAAFFDGFVRGVSGLVAVGVVVVKVITGIVQQIGRMSGLNKVFGDATTAARAFGMAMGLLVTGSIIGGIIRMIASITGVGIALNAAGAKGVLAWGGMGLLILAIVPHLDTVISKIMELVDWLNQAEVGGLGLGDALLSIGVGGAMMRGGGGTGRGLLTSAAGIVSRHPVGAGVVGLGAYGLWAMTEGPGVDQTNQPYDVGNTTYQNEVMSPYQSFVGTGSGVDLQALSKEYINLYGEGQSENVKLWDAFVANARQAENARELTRLQEEYLANYGVLPTYDLEGNKVTQQQRATGQYYADPELYNIAQRGATDRSLPGIQRDAQGRIIAGSSRKQTTTAAKEEADLSGLSFMDQLKELGISDQITGIADMFGIDLEGMTVRDIDKITAEYMRMGVDMSDLDWSWMGPKGESFGKALDNWETYQNILKKTGGDIEQARAIFKENMGFDAPTAAPDWNDYFASDELASEADRLAEAAAKIGLSMDDINNAFASLKGMSTEAFLNAQSPTGTSFGGLLAGGIGDTILGNIPEGTAPWMNKTELLYDAAGTGVNLGAAPGGKNMHTAMAPYLQIVADQTGLTVDQLLVDVPKFHAPEEFVGLASADIALGISEGLTQGEYLALDLLGADAGVKGYEAGMNWAELTDYAVGMAVEGHDWNLADFIAESWGYTIEEANAYLASHSIDPNAINSGMMEATEVAVLTGNGAFNAMTEEMYEYLRVKTGDFTNNVITMTQDEWAKIPPAYKAVMASLGITTIIQDMIPPEAINAALKATNDFTSAIANGIKGAAGAIEGFDMGAGQFKEVAREIDKATGQVMVTLEDLDGTQVTIPAAVYDAYQKSITEVGEITAEAKKHFDNANQYFQQARTRENPNDFSGYAAYGREQGLAWNAQGRAQPTTQADLGKALGIPEAGYPVKLTVDPASLETVKQTVNTALGQGEGQSLKIKIEADTAAFQTSLGGIFMDAGGGQQALKIKIEPDLTEFVSWMNTMSTFYSGAGIKVKITPDLTEFVSWMSTISTFYSGAGIKVKVTPDLTEFMSWMATIQQVYGSVGVKVKVTADLTEFTSTINAALGNGAAGEGAAATSGYSIKIKLEVDDTGLSVLNNLPGAPMGKTPAPKITVTVSQTGGEAVGQLLSGIIALGEVIRTTAWNANVTETGTALAQGMVASFRMTLESIVRTYVSTVNQSGAETAQGLVASFRTTLESIVRAYTATVNVTVNSGSLDSLISKLNGINGRTYTATATVTNTTVNRVVTEQYRGGYVNTATGGVIGSAGLLGRQHSAKAIVNPNAPIRDLVARAKGGMVGAGEYTLLGELGPEIVRLPAGSEVFTARESNRMLTNSLVNAPQIGGQGNGAIHHVTVNNNGDMHTGDTFNFNAPITIGSNQSANEFFEEVDRRAGRKTQLARRGMVPADDMKPW